MCRSCSSGRVCFFHKKKSQFHEKKVHHHHFLKVTFTHIKKKIVCAGVLCFFNDLQTNVALLESHFLYYRGLEEGENQSCFFGAQQGPKGTSFGLCLTSRSQPKLARVFWLEFEAAAVRCLRNFQILFWERDCSSWDHWYKT